MNAEPRQIERLKAEARLSAIVGETLQLRRDGREMVGLCPFHSERSPSFTVNDAKRFFHCFGCGAHGDVFDWLDRERGMSLAEAAAYLSGERGQLTQPPARRTADTPPPAADAPDEEAHRKRELARRIWSEAIPPAGTAAEAYLASRGLALPVGAPLRFHAACPCATERHPAMLAAMTDPVTGHPCGVHRTFLLPDGSGKAAVERPKMMLGSSGVIRLAPDAEVTLGLGISEGIENALTVMQRTGWRPVWAAGSAGAIRVFPPIPGVEVLTIFADADDSGAGIEAARTCAARWVEAGREVDVCRPPTGRDWWDALIGRAA